MSMGRFENWPQGPAWGTAEKRLALMRGLIGRTEGQKRRNGLPMMLMMLAALCEHHQHHWGPVSSCQASGLSVSTGPASSASLGLRFTNLEVSGAAVFFLNFYDGFWLAPGGLKLKKTTSGPNPWFWAQNHGFGPDVVIFAVNHPNTTKTDHIWPKPRFAGQMWSFWLVLGKVYTKSNHIWPKPMVLGPEPGLGQMCSF